MSWFSDIAGRAEDLLNKVDKSAASALQKGKESDRASYRDVPVGGEVLTPLPDRPKLSPSKPSPSQQRTSRSPYTPLKSRKREEQQEDEDDRLLAFLNSSEPLAKAAGPADSQPSPARQGTPTPTERETVTVGPGDSGNDPELSLPLSEGVGDCSQPSAPSADPGTPMKANDERRKSLEGEKSSDEVAVREAEPEPAGQPSQSDLVSVEPLRDTSQDRQGWTLEREVEHLKMEALQGRKVLQDLQRTLHEEQGEKRRLQKKLDHWSSQVSESDGLLRELQSRENDLKGLLSAKDSQLAVLRVRLQEADQQLDSCRTAFQETRSQLEEQVSLNSLQQQSLEDLRTKLSEAELQLRKEQQEMSRAQRESQDLLSQKEEELRGLSVSLATYQKAQQQLRGQNRELVQQLSQGRQSLDAAQQELSQYRSKAQRILHSKEKLIVALKERGGSTEDPLEESFQIVDPPGSLDSDGEREALREELAQAQALGQALRQELAACEQALALQDQAQEDQVQSLQDRLRTEEQKRREAQMEAQQNTEEIRYLREDLTRTKCSLQARLKDREAEIDKLRKQVTVKSLSQGNGVNSSQQRELESRLKNLTESLIHKQTMVEALSTEKNALSMQMEILERKVKEVQGTSSKSPTHIVGISTEGSRERLPSVFVESPYDSNMARKVKRAYSALDAFSIRMGSFLRRYPASRAFLFLYMAMLHVWVMVVLCTYQPEIHPIGHSRNQS